MNIKGDAYHVTYDPETATAVFQGSVRLLGVKDYETVKQLMDDIVTAAPETLTLDLRQLRFLNSLGTYLLMGFILKMRDNTSSHVIVHGLAGTHWQERAFGDLERLMPSIELRWSEKAKP